MTAKTVDFGTRLYMPTEGNSVFIKEMHLEKGYYVDTHKHVFEHYGILGKGAAFVEVDGGQTTYVAPAVIPILAGVAHRITALEDITWFCVHGTDATDENGIDDTLILKE